MTIARLWPLAALIAVVLALWGWGEHREKQGRNAERIEWEAEAARLREVAFNEAQKRQEAATSADTAARASEALIEALATQTRTEADAYYHSRPSVQCLAPERLRAIADADRKALAAASAAK